MANVIQRILVPVDFSAYSDCAVAYAAHLAVKLGASIELLHVVEDPFLSGAWSPEIYVPNVAEILETVANDAQLRLTPVTAATRAQGIPTSSVIRQGLPSHAIVEHAAAGHFDLIVMGTHGRTGVSHVLLGSVAERVLRHAPCPVLTLREPAADVRQNAPDVAAA